MRDPPSAAQHTRLHRDARPGSSRFACGRRVARASDTTATVLVATSPHSLPSRFRVGFLTFPWPPPSSLPSWHRHTPAGGKEVVKLSAEELKSTARTGRGGGAAERSQKFAAYG